VEGALEPGRRSVSPHGGREGSRRKSKSNRHWSSWCTATACHRFGARPFRRGERPPERARRGVSAGSPLQSRFGAGGGNPTRFGCPSLKTKTLDCTRRPERAARLHCTRCHNRQGGAGRHETSDPHEANPNFAHGEPKAAGSGTARVVAESNHGGLLNPNRCWDSVRRSTAGQPARGLRYPETFESRGMTSAHGTCRSKLFQ
jgi:hypothetical protein